MKASAIVGIGRRNIVDLGTGALAFDLVKLEQRLRLNREQGKGSIVAVGFGEINTFVCPPLAPFSGPSLTRSTSPRYHSRLYSAVTFSGGYTPDVPKLRELCDTYGAWLHIDAAFGAFAAALPELSHYVKDLELADSIVADGHKWLNVPYDLGLFFTRSSASLPRSFGPSPASVPPPYLTPGKSVTTQPDIPSPLNVGIENSRRFRALPLYASLVSLGRNGYVDLVRRNVEFANRIKEWIQFEGAQYFELLNPMPLSTTDKLPLNIVLFRATSSVSSSSAFHPDQKGSGQALTELINDGRRIYVSPTTAWDGKGAVRVAVSNWAAGSGGEKEWERIRGALIDVGEKILQ